MTENLTTKGSQSSKQDPERSPLMAGTATEVVPTPMEEVRTHMETKEVQEVEAQVLVTHASKRDTGLKIALTETLMKHHSFLHASTAMSQATTSPTALLLLSHQEEATREALPTTGVDHHQATTMEATITEGEH